MRRLALSLLLIALLAMPVAAGDGKIVWVEEVAVESAPITSRIVFILDVSGSMRGAPIAVASTNVLRIMGRPHDQAFVKIYVFNDTCWSLGDEWMELPDLDLVQRVAEQHFLDLATEGNTNVSGALETALLENLEVGVSFVLLSDGEPTGPQKAHLEALAATQAAREKKGADRAVVHVIGVREILAHHKDEASSFLEAIARENDGSCMIVRQVLVH